MTIYATLSDLSAQFGDREVLALTDRNGDGVPDTAVVAMALKRASDTIDGYLASRFPLPITVVPDQLVDICCDLARYKLCGAEVTETEEIRNRYKDAIKTLEKIRDRQVDIGLSDAGLEPTETPAVQMVGGSRVFTDDSMKGF